MKVKKIVLSGILACLICLTSGCQNQADSVKEESLAAESGSVVQGESGNGEEIDLSALVQNAMEENEIYSEDRGFEFPQAEWGCSLDQMAGALGVTFDTLPVLSGTDSFAYLSVGYSEVFGYEARVQAEVYQEQVNALTFQMEHMDDPDTVITAVSSSLEALCGAPVRESEADAPAAISVWEQGDTSLTLSASADELTITMGKGLDTVNIYPTEITVEDLRNEAGEYQADGAAWGMDEETLPGTLGIRFYDIPVSSNETLTVYPSRDLTVILGYPARVQAEYHADGLAQLTFEIETDDAAAAFGQLLQELTAQYGEEYTEINNEEAQRTAYRWESGTTPNTALQLSQMADAVTIDLVRFDS